jgi:DNA-binding protein HU-beta
MQKSATPGKAETVTLRDLGAALAETHGLPKKQVNDMLTGMVAAVGGHLKKGRRTRFNGLGILQVRKRAARMGRNPATSEATRSRPARKSHSAPPRT